MISTRKEIIQRPKVSLPDLRGLTEVEAESAVRAAWRTAAESELVPIFIDGSFAGSLRDARANYPSVRTEIEAAVEGRKIESRER